MRDIDHAIKIITLVGLLTACLSISRDALGYHAEPIGFAPVFQKGMSYRHYPFPYDSSFSNESLKRLADTNTEYVGITVWWLQENVSATQIYRKPSWTATDVALATAIAKAHELGLKVMLKPMVDPQDVYSHWRGEIPPSQEWFANYTSFLIPYAKFAQKNSVDLFCIGCEFKATEHDAASWRQVIEEVKRHYTGPLTYAAAYDSFQGITWWDTLDYVGIDAYFPLTNKKDPTLDELEQAWNRIANAIEAWISTIKKPIVFTEVGYRSGDGNNVDPANWIVALNVDLQEQSDCHSAAFQALWNRPWFYGCYWWIWESDPNAGGLSDTDFTPQNKPVEQLIRSWYATERHIEQTFDSTKLVLHVGLSTASITVVTLIATRKLGNKKQMHQS